MYYRSISMTKIEQLKKRPKIFRRLTGLTIEKYDEIYPKLEELYAEFNSKRLDRKGRKRRIGGGNQFRLCLEDRLLMLLMYYRLYVPHIFLGFLFGIDDSNVGRNINPLQPLLAKIFTIPERKIDLSENEILELFIDGTEQTINRPKKGQRKWYSGKKKKHTIQHQVIVTKTGTIKGVGKSSYGKTHDKKDYENKKFVIDPKVKRTGDLAYLGTGMTVPIKKKKGKKLTKEEKLYNRQLASVRVVVEHTIGKMKIFRILSERFRNPLKDHNLIFKNIAGIHNLMFA